MDEALNRLISALEAHNEHLATIVNQNATLIDILITSIQDQGQDDQPNPRATLDG